MTRIYVPRDSSALALGADALAEAITSEAARRGIAIELIRNGSRGLLWLEPLVEVETADGRIGYSNVEADDVAALFDAGFHEGQAHEKNVGIVDEIPYLKKQQRLTFARIGITDPLSITRRSEKVPESPSSALQTTYFCAAFAPRTVRHLMPAGKAAPPRPRRPDSISASQAPSPSVCSARRRPSRPPCAT